MKSSFFCAVVLVFPFAFSCTAKADPDYSFVRAVVGDNESQVIVSGRTRYDMVEAVYFGLEKIQAPVKKFAVGNWIQLPEAQLPEEQIVLTICSGDTLEGGNETVYLGVSDDTPLQIVAAIANQLREAGYKEIRLISEETVRQDIMQMFQHNVPKQESAQ